MSSQIQKGLENLIRNHEKGLCIVALPTGSGKSYSVKNILFEALLNTKDNRKYVCITSAIKNKLVTDLRKLCNDPESEELFNKYVIDLKANGDMVQSNFETVDVDRINDPELKNKYEKLYAEIKKDRLLKDSKSEDYIDNRKGVEIAEREFRKEAHRYLKEKYRSYSKEKIMDFLSEENCEDHWLVRLFPGMLVKKKKIIFMTVAKFAYPYDNILETPFYFYEDNDFKHGVFYIDEFDQAKKSMLKQIINRDINNYDGKIDLLGMFNNIFQSISRGSENLPREFFSASDLERKRGYDEQALRELFDRLEKSAKEINDEYHLAYELKTKDASEDDKSFLFHDTTITTPIGKQDHKTFVVMDKTEKTNFIHKTSDSDLRLETVLKRIEGYLRYFVRACYAYAINIRENQVQKGNNFYELSDAISSVTSTLRIAEPYNDFIHKQVLYGGFGERRNTSDNIGDNFYERGFNLFTIEDSNSHSMNSIIKMEIHEDTPEKILLKMSRHGLTIGLSATGDIETCIENFDLPFLAEELKDDYLYLDPLDMELIKKEYEANVKKQEGIYRICFTDQYTKDNELECYRNIFEDLNVDENYANDFLENIKNNIGKFDTRKHIYNLLWSFDKFLFSNEVYSYLCLLNTYLKKHIVFIKGLINELIDKYILAGYTQYIGKTADDLFEILDSENFEQKKKDILKKLSEGNKLFILSTFPALATGQNLQYKVPEQLKFNNSLIVTNERQTLDDEKDFDGIFVEKPTNLLVKLSDPSELTAESRVEAMFQAEELKTTGEISKNTMLKVLNRIAGNGGNSYESLYEKESIKNAEAITIIQGIGRIDRTAIKNKHVRVDAEYDVINSFSDELLNSSRLVAPVIKELYSVIASKRTEKKGSKKSDILQNKAADRSDYLGNHIYNLMNGSSTWTNESIEKWEQLNNNLLIDPQGLSENVERSLYIDLLEETNKYYYRQTGDFRNNEIFFELPLFDTDCHEVSEKGTRLEALMSIPEIKQLFEDNRYATTFAPSKRMLAPVIANNLLKGRYGEVVGKYLIEKYAGIVLEKITDPKLYEKFDFHINNYAVVIDFKNWSEKTRFDNKYYVDKLIRKAKDCGSKLVLAINIISNENYVPYEQVVDGISIKEIPNIIVRKNDEYEINFDIISKIGEIIRGYM